MKRKSFTLVEILVVVAVLAILMGLLFPALGVIREKASYRQSQTEAKSIQMAIKSFKTEYHYLPDSTTGNDVVYYGAVAKGTTTTTDKTCAAVFTEDGSLQSDYIDLFSVLCYLKPTGAISSTDSADAGLRNLNPRGIKFLEPSKKYSRSEDTAKGYRDPWGRPYVIFLDTNYDGQIEMPGSTSSNRFYVYDDVAVVGLGTFDGTNLSNALKTPEKAVLSWQ